MLVEIQEPNLDPKQAFTNLEALAKDLGEPCLNVAMTLLGNPNFKIWSASSRTDKHHYGDGMLVAHTNEVVTISNLIAEMYSGRYSIDPIEIYLAALFHDAGKLYDYKQIKPEFGTMEYYMNETWGGNPHRRLIHHVSRSGLIWHDAAQKDEFIFEHYHDSVLHAILSHHGSREFGSPVAPKTRTAWIVHYADALSARIFDADTFDVVKA